MFFPSQNELHKRASTAWERKWEMIKWINFHFRDHLNISQRIHKVGKFVDNGKFRLSKRYNRIPVKDYVEVDHYPIRITLEGIWIDFEEPYFEEEMASPCGFCPPCTGFLMRWKKNKPEMK
jgi:hypothetical protein